MNLIKLAHVPTMKGKGKWQTKRGLKRYLLKRRRLNKIKKMSRKANWN